MFVLLSSITRPGCRDCSRSVAQSEVSHRAKPARPEPPTNRRRTQPTKKPTNRDVVNRHPVQAILASPSLPHRYTPVDHSCSFLCQVLNHVYLELHENSLSLFLEHFDNTQEESITLFTLQCRSECLTQFVCITYNFPTWSSVGYNPPPKTWMAQKWYNMMWLFGVKIKQKAIFTPLDAFVPHLFVAFLLCWLDVEIHFSSETLRCTLGSIRLYVFSFASSSLLLAICFKDVCTDYKMNFIISQVSRNHFVHSRKII